MVFSRKLQAPYKLYVKFGFFIDDMLMQCANRLRIAPRQSLDGNDEAIQASR